jgi:hypothetical protein
LSYVENETFSNGNQETSSFSLANVPFDWNDANSNLGTGVPFSEVDLAIDLANVPGDSQYFSSIAETWTPSGDPPQTFIPDWSRSDFNLAQVHFLKQ